MEYNNRVSNKGHQWEEQTCRWKNVYNTLGLLLYCFNSISSCSAKVHLPLWLPYQIHLSSMYIILNISHVTLARQISHAIQIVPPAILVSPIMFNGVAFSCTCLLVTNKSIKPHLMKLHNVGKIRFFIARLVSDLN